MPIASLIAPAYLAGTFLSPAKPWILRCLCCSNDTVGVEHFDRYVQLSLAIPNPSVPWKIVQYIQRFGIEGVPSPGNTVTSPGRTVQYVQRFSIEAVPFSERHLYVSFYNTTASTWILAAPRTTWGNLIGM